MTFLRQYRWGFVIVARIHLRLYECLHVSMHMFRQYHTSMYARECMLRHGLYMRMCVIYYLATNISEDSRLSVCMCVNHTFGL